VLLANERKSKENPNIPPVDVIVGRLKASI